MLVWLGWRAVTDADLRRATIQFIVLGLVLALTWLRLGAPDVALAEAAVGSGLTGALLWMALRRQQDDDGKPESASREEQR
ncbi:MAG TPA: sodium:proton antiporter [Verrucomicrobiales bacterium]|nr:sodium:proton antiporter [Verrucomicrobiales bacterium]